MKKKKKNRKVGIGFKIFSFVLTILSILLVGMLIYLNVLSDTLLGIVIGVVLIINIICSYLLLKSNKKKFGLFISSILILCLSIVNFYLYKTTDFLSNLGTDYKTYNYSVVVLKTSDYKKLKDINNKNLGYYDEENDITDDALSKVSSKIEINVESYDNTHDMVVDLFSDEVDAILIEDNYLNVIEMDGVTIDQNVKKIYSFSIRIKVNDTSKDLNVTKEAFNVYISGIDTFGEISSVSRSDVNMVVTVNPNTREVLMTSIPRDYYVKLHGKSGYPDKLTHAGMYGTEMSVATIEDLLDIEINYYVKVNFTSVIDIVDELGGVNVYSDYTFTSRDNYSYKEGYNQVDGKKALSFVRERKAFATGDRQRVRNQQALLEAIIKKCMSKSIVTKYTKLLDTLGDSFVTNMKMNRMTSLVKMQLIRNYDWNIVSNSLNGTDASNYTYSAPNARAYVMEPIEESVSYASSLINKVISGEKLNKEEIESNKKIGGGVVSSNNSSTKTTEKSNTKNESNVVEEKEGLKANLIKSSIEINKGDDYIYHGVIATYDKKDITNDSNLSVTYKINGKIISDYHELILYISKLDSGNYSVIHVVSYNGETINLNQSLIINDVINNVEDVPPVDDTNNLVEEDNYEEN